MELYPLKFIPVFMTRIWGGQKLREVFGKEIPAGEKIGESWELADIKEGKSTIANGILAGKTLGEVICEYPEEITGDKNFSGPFPLLIKLLDSHDVLSVQVHPDVETCKRMGTGEPKTECWYIISADSGSVIYKGLKKGVSREAFSEAIKKGTVEDLLNKIEVHAGECHFLPAGTVHAIGSGLLIAEIQMPSDTTYRVFDWNRVDADGKSRQLHIAQSLESINFEREEQLKITTQGRLVDCEFFRIDKFEQAKDSEILLERGQMKVLVFINGAGIVGNKEGVSFKGGDCFLIPACFKGKIKAAQASEYLLVTI